MSRKGFTLVELIISVALISIVLIFLFRLFTDVRYQDNNVDFNRANQQNRAVILKTIQEDFLERTLIGMQDVTGVSNSFIRLKFKYADETTGRLEIGEDYITYQNALGEEKWILEKDNSFTHYAIHCASHYNSLFYETEGDFFSVSFTIPVIASKNSSNSIDDLEFFYIGEKKEISLDDFSGMNKGTLGQYDTSTCR